MNSNNKLPKYKQVINWIEEKIYNGEYVVGKQIPTEIQLTKCFNVSRHTIRQAINYLEQEGIVERIQGRGTFVVEKIKNQRGISRHIGIIITYLNDYIFPEIIHGIESVLTDNDYSMSLKITNNNTHKEAIALQQLLNDQIDGLIIEGTKSALPSPNLKQIHSFHKSNIPLVFINGFYNSYEDSYIVMDDVKSAEILTQYLIDQGHHNIGAIFKSDDIQGIKRYEGFVRCLQKNNLLLKDEKVLWYTTEDVDSLFNGDFDTYISKRFKNSSALVCYNDEIASKIINLFHRQDIKMPENYSIVGFDNSQLSYPELYNLTTITYPARQIGQTAAKVLLGMLKNPKNKKKIKINPKLIIRGSVKKLL